MALKLFFSLNIRGCSPDAVLLNSLYFMVGFDSYSVFEDNWFVVESGRIRTCCPRVTDQEELFTQANPLPLTLHSQLTIPLL